MAQRDLHRLEKHSITITGHRTSITLEAAFWLALKDIARRRNKAISELVAEVDQARSGLSPSPNLSSALRVFVLQERETNPSLLGD